MGLGGVRKIIVARRFIGALSAARVTQESSLDRRPACQSAGL